MISCGRGCDRTGLLALLLLHVVGVAAEDIATDYALSIEQMPARDPHYGAQLNESLERHATSLDKAIAAVVSGPVFETLNRGGLAAEDIASLRARFVEP